MTTLQISAYELSDNYEVRAYLDDEIYVFECETHEQALTMHCKLVSLTDQLVEILQNKYTTKEKQHDN